MDSAQIFACPIMEDSWGIHLCIEGTNTHDVSLGIKAFQSVVDQLKSDGWVIDCPDLGEIDFRYFEQYDGEGSDWFYPVSLFVEASKDDLDRLDWQKFREIKKFTSDWSHGCIEYRIQSLIAEIESPVVV